MSAPKERQILFSAPMVRAILDGRKTQTRRAVKPQHLSQIDVSRGSCVASWTRPMPYGRPGDRLWVRERWAVGNVYDGISPSKIGDWNPPGVKHASAPCGVAYPASGGCVGLKLRSPIHMPRWASRILLEVTGVRVERLQDISEADARAEGLRVDLSRGLPAYSARQEFERLWESINGPGSWDANPWVWVVEFRRLDSAPRAEGEW